MLLVLFLKGMCATFWLYLKDKLSTVSLSVLLLWMLEFNKRNVIPQRSIFEITLTDHKHWEISTFLMISQEE